ncbi:MAG: hypothetical protein U0931_11700 [Vulcanimicrobiota bacterium]
MRLFLRFLPFLLLGCNQLPGPSSPTPTASAIRASVRVSDAAAHFPAGAYFWVGCNLQGRLDGPQYAKAFDRVTQSDPRLAEVARELETVNSPKLRELLSVCCGSFHLGLYPGHGASFPSGRPKATDLLIELHLQQPEVGERWLRRFLSAEKATTVAGHPAGLDENNFCYCRVDRSFWIASDQSSLEKALALPARDSLGEDARFKEALARLSPVTEESGAFAYLDMALSWESGAHSAVTQDLDAEGIQGLSSVRGFVASLTPRADNWDLEVFASIQGEHEFAQALRAPHRDSRRLFKHVPRHWGAVQSFDLAGWYAIALANVRLFPEGRRRLPEFLKSHGLGPQGKREKLLRQALNGEALLCLDLKGWASQQEAEPYMVLLLGCQDPQALGQLLQQLGLSKSRGWTRFHDPEALAIGLNPGKAGLDAIQSFHPLPGEGGLGTESLAELPSPAAALSWLDFQPLDESLKNCPIEHYQTIRDQFPDYRGITTASLQLEPQGWRLRAHRMGRPIRIALSLGLGYCLDQAARHAGSEELKDCQQNCKHLGTALEMYAIDHDGHYPRKLLDLLPGHYLERVPKCPAAAEDSYSASYKVNQQPDRFTLNCSGHHHGGLAPANFPGYSSESGLRLSP